MFEINLKKYNKIILILFILDSLFLIVGYSCISEIVKDIAIGLFISFIFYYIVVFIPVYINKEIQKKVFLDFYDKFKASVIREILTLSEFDQVKDDIYDKIKELKDPKKFKEYFGEQSEKEGQTNWHVVINNITEKEYKQALLSIVDNINELRRELYFLSGKVQIDDPELLKWMRHIDRVLQDGRFKKDLDWNWGEDEKFTNALYEMFSGFSLVTGDEGDFIKKRIDKL